MKLRVLTGFGVGIAIPVLLGMVAAGQAGPAGSFKTAWGEPDLQGIWSNQYDTPLQRAAKYADREFFTAAEMAEFDKARAAIQRREYRDRDATGKGTEQDVAGAYNSVFESYMPTGKRTSLIVDPPNGRMPAYTPEANKRRQDVRQFALALMQNTETCRVNAPACRGGKYGPPAPQRDQVPPFYNVGRLNRNDGPEDRALVERCLAQFAGNLLPQWSGGYFGIVQGPQQVSIFYDFGQGQGMQRVIPVTNAPHLPEHVRQWMGDSRGRWEGNTLVVDVTNFNAKAEFLGARQNLHLVEKWTRADANTIEYAVTIEDPTTWTRPWTVKNEFTKQPTEANRIYPEPRCVEGNYGLVGMLANTRAEEIAFAEGRGPNPASRDTSTGGAGGGDENRDPLLAGGE
jgi:hypothetical protein